MCILCVALDGHAMDIRYISQPTFCQYKFRFNDIVLGFISQLISASTDNNVCIWDILSGDCEQKFRFPSPVLKVQFDPRNDQRCLVCPMRYAAVLVDINGTHKCLPYDSDVSSRASSVFFLLVIQLTETESLIDMFGSSVNLRVFFSGRFKYHCII